MRPAAMCRIASDVHWRASDPVLYDLAGLPIKRMLRLNIK